MVHGDTISSSDTEPAFDYNSEYYYSSGDVYKVTFSSDGTGGYNITVSSLPEDTTSCGAGAGAGAGAGTSQSLDSSACDAFNSNIAYSITYTDNGDTFFGNGDTISSSDTEPAFDYNSEYYYSSGDVYKVTFSSDGTGGYNITVSSLPEDTTSCGAGAGAGAGAGTSQSLDSSACDAFNSNIAYSITYTDNGDTFFGNGDTISSSDTEPAFDYNSEYYYSSGDVYKVTFSSDGTGGYNITVSSLPEDTTSCGAGAGAGAGAGTSQSLDSSACDAFNSTSAYSITYTDNGDSLLW